MTREEAERAAALIGAQAPGLTASVQLGLVKQ